MNSLAVSSLESLRSKRNNYAFKQSTPTNINNVPAPAKPTNNSMSKTLPIITSALALASLGFATFAAFKKPNSLKNLERKLETVTTELTESKKTQETLKNSLTQAEEKLNTVKTEAEQKVNGLREHVDNNLNDVRNGINEAKNGVNEVRGIAQNPKVVEIPSNMMTREVVINDMPMQLAKVMHGYGEQEDILTNELRSESTRRILGAVKPIQLPENAAIHAPTAEFQGFTKAGGLAVVPRELIANLGAVVNNKQKAELFVDTPLYIGQIENNAYLDVRRVGENKYEYFKKIITNPNDASKDKEQILATMEKVDEMNLDIFTDKGVNVEKVGVFLSGEQRQAVSYEETLAQFDDKSLVDHIRASMKAGEDVDTQLVRFTAPKPSTSKVTLTTKKADGSNETLAVDFNKAIAQLKPEEAKKIEEYHKIGKDYEIPMDRFVINEGNQMKIFDDAAAGRISKDMDAARIAQEAARAKALAEGKNEKEVEAAVKAVPVPKIRFVAPQPEKAEVKFRAVFYDNRKFNMGAPKMPGLDKNMYNNHAFQAGETERFTYFNKYMYENLFESHRHSDKPLRADWIIGNDWHTGGLSAMTRLLTAARRAHGEIDPRRAEKLQNTPITTLMHNFKLSGAVDHSQAKLINIMYGEHAAKITENAWMPQNADLPSSLWNGMFSGQRFNPQTMAMSYSDDIVFVSRGNFAEAANIREKGGDNYMLASMRGRTWQFADKNRLNEIGKVYGIKPEEIPDTPTAKGITNGCDRVNNIITTAKARTFEENLGLEVGSLQSVEKAMKDPYGAHQNNKKVYLAKVVEEVQAAKNGGENKLLIHDIEHTDLKGVTENTPVFAMAGRIEDQKGIDIYAAGYEELIRSGRYDKENPPVFWLNGKGNKDYINAFLATKSRIREIDPVAADRMIFSGTFGEPGRYDGVKMFSDFSNMSSWDEPCGLVHKEIGYTSGAISIVNKVGGLRDGLVEYVPGAENKGANSIFVDFVDKDTHDKDYALRENAKAWGRKFGDALEWYKNKDSFAEGIKSSYLSRHDWLLGKVQEYTEIGKKHGVLAKSVDSNYSL